MCAVVLPVPPPPLSRALNNKNAAAPIVVVIFFIEFSLAKDKSNILSTSVRFFPFNKTTLSLLFRAYPARSRAEMKGAHKTRQQKTKAKIKKEPKRQIQFSWACSRRDLFPWHISATSERCPGWSSALIVH